MKTLVLACLAAALLTPAAHASGQTYTGGCGWDTVHNPTGNGALGGTDVWTGAADVYVVPTDSSGLPTGGAVTAWCELRINGESRGTVLGPVSGTGAVAAAGPWQFRAHPYDNVTICTHVTTSAGPEVVCPDVALYQFPPQPVADLVDYVLGPAYPVLDEVDSTIVQPAVTATDVAACAVLGGDTFAGPYWVWDCPPFEETR